MKKLLKNPSESPAERELRILRLDNKELKFALQQSQDDESRTLDYVRTLQERQEKLENTVERLTAELEKAKAVDVNKIVEAATKIIISANEDGEFLIWSHGRDMYWKPNERGYTSDPAEAGRYSGIKARKICNDANAPGRIDESMVPVDE